MLPTFFKTAMPVRVMKLLGVKKIIVTNAGGGLNKAFQVTDWNNLCFTKKNIFSNLVIKCYFGLQKFEIPIVLILYIVSDLKMLQVNPIKNRHVRQNISRKCSWFLWKLWFYDIYIILLWWSCILYWFLSFLNFVKQLT